MYNGVGVQTARGTGTSGHVRKNLSALRPTRPDVRRFKDVRENPTVQREEDPGIIQHNKLRKIEIKLLELRDELETEYEMYFNNYD
jgi:serine/arginine repetitive matrix protein 2